MLVLNLGGNHYYRNTVEELAELMYYEATKKFAFDLSELEQLLAKENYYELIEYVAHHFNKKMEIRYTGEYVYYFDEFTHFRISECDLYNNEFENFIEFLNEEKGWNTSTGEGIEIDYINDCYYLDLTNFKNEEGWGYSLDDLEDLFEKYENER